MFCSPIVKEVETMVFRKNWLQAVMLCVAIFTSGCGGGGGGESSSPVKSIPQSSAGAPSSSTTGTTAARTPGKTGAGSDVQPVDVSNISDCVASSDLEDR